MKLKCGFQYLKSFVISFYKFLAFIQKMYEFEKKCDYLIDYLCYIIF